MGLETPTQIRTLQRKLYCKAKQEPTFRFYSLYDKVYRTDILAHAYYLAKANKGKPGVDGQTFEDIEKYGLYHFLAELREELKTGRYRPQAVRRVMIPKANGGERPLGIPTIRDRVAQTAAKLVLEPIFEADFTDDAYGYRPERSAQQAVAVVHEGLKAGYVQVVDADLSKYFDTIPHGALLRSIARRVSDGRILHLIKQWLTTPVEERNERGKPIRRNAGSRGTPQGGVISPLLANIYMRRFLKAWEQRGSQRRLPSRIVNYADDFVILCRGQAEQAMAEAGAILEAIGLTLNERKTRVCRAWRESFDFLGYSFGVQYAFGGGRKYLGAYPSVKNLKRFKEMIRGMTGPKTERQDTTELIGAINHRLRGWSQYFNYGSLWKAYVELDQFTQERVRCWLARKHKLDTRGENRFPAKYIYSTLGLINIPKVLAARRMPCGGA